MKRLILLAGIWGWSFLFIKVAVEGMSPPTVAFSRVALGVLTLVVLLRIRGGSIPRDRMLWIHFTVVGFFGSALPFTLLAWGEERITSALTAVLNASTPMFTAVAAACVLRDRLRAVQVGGLVLGLVGVMLAAGLGGTDLSHSSVSGSSAAVVAGASYGLAFAWMRRHLTGIPPMVAAVGQLITASILLAPLALATSLRSGLTLEPELVASVVLLGVMGTGIAYVINYRVIAELGATRASLVTYVVPMIAVAAGVVVLEEPFETSLVLGGALIVAGIALVHERLLPPKPSGLRGAGVVLVLALSATSLLGCGGSGGAESAACRPPQRERLDTNLGHVLPGAPQPRYISDPPTSGQHQPSPPLRGFVDKPISRPVQVGQLEEGAVLVQYHDLDPDDIEALEPLVDDHVAIAPNADLPDGARIVATAWVWKQVCNAVDVEALEAFVTAHAGKGPGHR